MNNKGLHYNNKKTKKVGIWGFPLYKQSTIIQSLVINVWSIFMTTFTEKI